MSTTGGRSASAAQQSHLQRSVIALLDRAYGKAPTFSTTDTQAVKRAIDMTDDELAAIASGAKLTILK